jgi:hypothetical protein
MQMVTGISQRWKIGFFLLSACFIIIFLLPGESMSNEQNSAGANLVISVEPGSLGIGLPSEERLIDIGRELATSLFPDDVEKSLRVRGRIALMDRGKDYCRFDLSFLFLYRESYTAVDHHVVFDVTGEKVTVVSSR